MAIKKTFFSYKKLWVGIVSFTVLAFSPAFFSLWTHGKKSPAQAPFTLTDQNGNVYSSQESESYKLIFFGFTHCPEVCPTGLYNMGQVLVALGEMAQEIQPIFITVDPARDKPEVIKAYMKNLHPRLIGLTGSSEELEAIRKKYAVYTKKVKPPGYDSYLMDHSAHIYFTDKYDRVLEVFDYRMVPDKMVGRIKLYL